MKKEVFNHYMPCVPIILINETKTINSKTKNKMNTDAKELNNEHIKSITGDITPLPWKFEENEFNWNHDFNGIGSIISSRESNDKWFVAEIEQGCKHHIEKFSSEQLESKANAAYIVKAANEYPSLKLLNNELLDVLKKMMEIKVRPFALTNDELYNIDVAQKLIKKLETI